MFRLNFQLPYFAAIGLSLSLAACATVPEASLTAAAPVAIKVAAAPVRSHRVVRAAPSEAPAKAATKIAWMALGAQTVAPDGFLTFCVRSPDQCGVSEVDAQVQQVVANQRRWQAVFTQSQFGPSQSAASLTTTSILPESARNASGYDWAAAFARARALRNSAVAPEADAIAQEPLAASDDQLLAPIEVVAEQILPAPQNMAMVRKINDRINRKIARRADANGSDVWSMPLLDKTRAGDCEDYVLEKHAALVQAGVAPSALSIAVVRTGWGESHAVLLIATDKGEFVLDNLSPWVVSWDKTTYRWISRQKAGAAFDWVSVDGENTAKTTTASTLLIASLQ
jgi:predicted transglutaminase-like cysteine proteinase